MENSQAFVQPVPLLSQKRLAASQPRICMADESKPSPDPSSSKENAPSSKPIKTVKSSASWANVFLPEFGKKGPGSRPDWDLRPMSLRSEAEGKGICDSCKGTGSMTCSFCSGLIHMAADGSIVPCPACKGESKVTCGVCFGSGKQIEMTGKWWERGVAALFKE